MPNGIEVFADGRDAFFTNREPLSKWLGKAVEGAQSAEDAITLAEMDWTVSKHPIYTSLTEMKKKTETFTPNADILPIEGKFAIIRDDIARPLGVVGNQFTPVQNAEAFAFCDAIVDESGANYVGAGALYFGRKTFLCMKLPGDILIGGEDAVSLYLYAMNAHDGSSAFRVCISPTRIRCMNQLTGVFGSAKRQKRYFSVRHTRNVARHVQQAREALTLTWKYVEDWELQMNSLIAQPFSANAFDEMVRVLTNYDNVDEDTKAFTLASNLRDTLHDLRNAPTQDGIRDTKYGAFNTVVEYADYFMPIRGAGRQEKLAARMLEGTTDKLKARAFALLS